jgi:hypothetical protein
MKTRGNRARWIMRCSRSPDRSPVNGIPVRSPPKRPGASPTNATAAGAAPSPGTTRERHRTSAGHRAHSLIDARNRSKGSRKLGLRVGESVRNLSTRTVVDPMLEDFPDEFAAQVAFRGIVELAPHAAAAQQVKFFRRHVGPRDAPDALRPSASFTRINQLTGCGKCRFDQSHGISKSSRIVCPRDNMHNRIDLKAVSRSCARILSVDAISRGSPQG